jgi:hypothetical protein
VFYFQQLFNTAMVGIEATAIIPTVTNIAFAILVVGFLAGVYQAALHGGDLQALVITAIKYLVVAMIIANWPSVFRDINGSFNATANFIGSSSSAGDMFLNWMTQLQQQATTNPALTFWDIITGDPAGAITVILLVVAYLLYVLAIIVFCFFYTLFGSVLYVLGPLVLAVIPISGTGQLGKTYAINVMVWNAWGILYAIFGALITAIHFNQVNDVLSHGFMGFLRGVPDSVMLGLVSIFYALAIALIPFIAKRVVSGDVGTTVVALVRAASVAAGAAVAGVSGFVAGAGAAETGAGSSAGAGAGGATGVAAKSTGMTSSSPPPTPSMSSFLRAGIAGAANGDVGPPAPSASANGAPSVGNRSGAVDVGTKTSGSISSYRPRGVAQAITVSAGRVLGKAVGSNSHEDGNE